MKKILRTFAMLMAPLTLASAIIAFVWPQSFLPFSGIFKELFAMTMFALGVVLDPSDLVATLRHPQRIGLGVLTQYLVMPVLAFGIAQLAGLPPALGWVLSSSAAHRALWRRMSSCISPAGRWRFPLPSPPSRPSLHPCSPRRWSRPWLDR